MPIAEPQVKSRFKPTIDLPGTVSDFYERQAQVEKKPLDQVLQERLIDCVGHNAVKGLWFNDSDRQALEKALQANVSGPEDVIRLIARATTLKIGPATVQISPLVLDRLRSRCDEADFSAWVSAKVSYLLDLLVEGQI